MASFLPSFFQKRLLRYALSRLELVDTEALDLDSLGIRWGQRSTVELRDIGLRLEVIFLQIIRRRGDGANITVETS
jgi:autophagy-related protein 2